MPAPVVQFLAAPSSVPGTGGEVAPQQAATDLLQWMAQQLPETSAKPLLAQGQGYLATKQDGALLLLLAKHASLLPQLGIDMEAPYNQLLSYLPQIQEADKVKGVVQTLVQSILQQSGTLVPESLKVLSNLYNVLDAASPLRREVFVALVQVAGKLQALPSILLPALPLLSTWAKEWALTANQERELLLQLVDAAAPTMPKESLVLLLRWLATPGAAALPQAKGVAERAILAAIRSKEVMHFEDLYASVQQCMKGTPLLELLQIFLDGSLAQYRAFGSKHAGFMAKHGLSEEDNVRKMRLLTLTSLMNDKSSIAYAPIAKALEVPEPEGVESWVVEGIRSGLIDGKMNPLSRTVTIHRSTHRVFGVAEWKELAGKLADWKGHLDSLLAVMRKEGPLLHPVQQ